MADFTKEETRTAVRNALAQVANRMGESYPAVIRAQDMEPRVITENTMRRGFSPDILI